MNTAAYGGDQFVQTRPKWRVCAVSKRKRNTVLFRVALLSKSIVQPAPSIVIDRRMPSSRRGARGRKVCAPRMRPMADTTMTPAKNAALIRSGWDTGSRPPEYDVRDDRDDDRDDDPRHDPNRERGSGWRP